MSTTLDVLVVDDEPIVGRRLKRALERIGCAVEIFTDPVAARERIGAHRFDVVVTDMLMDEVDGMAILKAVSVRSPETRVIVITGYAMMEMAREAMESGAYDFITKPFGPDVIRDSVRRAGASLGIELPDPPAPAPDDHE